MRSGLRWPGCSSLRARRADHPIRRRRRGHAIRGSRGAHRTGGDSHRDGGSDLGTGDRRDSHRRGEQLRYTIVGRCHRRRSDESEGLHHLRCAASHLRRQLFLCGPGTADGCSRPRPGLPRSGGGCHVGNRGELGARSSRQRTFAQETSRANRRRMSHRRRWIYRASPRLTAGGAEVIESGVLRHSRALCRERRGREKSIPSAPRTSGDLQGRRDAKKSAVAFRSRSESSRVL